MNGNRSTQLCEACNSHVGVHRENGKIIISCSYCGHRPEEIQLTIGFEEEDEEE